MLPSGWAASRMYGLSSVYRVSHRNVWSVISLYGVKKSIIRQQNVRFDVSMYDLSLGLSPDYFVCRHYTWLVANICGLSPECNVFHQKCVFYHQKIWSVIRI